MLTFGRTQIYIVEVEVPHDKKLTTDEF